MTDQTQDQINRRAFDVEKAGIAKFGDSFRQGVYALCAEAAAQRVNPKAVTEAMFQVDGVDRVWNMARDALISQADTNEDARRAYSALRSKEREEYAKAKGRR